MIGYRPDIDGLRSVAVVPVVLFHAGLPFLGGGYVGVDVFFVISGYLITAILAREMTEKRFSIVSFYERRARRILPALITVVAATLAVAFIVASPQAFEKLSRSALSTMGFVANVYFWNWSTDYFASAAEFDPLLHMWSLAVEEQFYIVFPILLWLLVRYARRWLLPLVVLGCVVSLALAIVLVPTKPNAAFYLLPTRAWELGVGALLALGMVRPPGNDRLAGLVAGAGLAVVVACFLLYDATTPFPGLAAVPPVIGAAAVIWAGTGARRDYATARVLSTAPLVGIGLASYSLYLWHWPILALMRVYRGEVHLPPSWAVAAVAMSGALAVLSLRFVERPFRARPPRGPSRVRVFILSAGSVGAVCAACMLVISGAGLPQRFDPAVQLAYAGARDAIKGLRCTDQRPDRDPCIMGDADGPLDFLLWGDSHARALMPGFALAAERSERSGLAALFSACSPIIGIRRVDQTSGARCTAHNAEVVDALAARNDARTVFLVSRWALAAEGRRMPGESGDPAIIVDAADPRPGSVEANFAVFDAGLARTIDALVATGREVVILGGVPEIGWSVPEALGRSLQFERPLPPVPERADVERRSRRAKAALLREAEHPRVHFVDVAAVMCDLRCRVESEGRPLYYDDDHLSVTGARAIVPDLVMPFLAGADAEQAAR